PASPAGLVRNLVFITKIQPNKRPDLFVRAAAIVMLQRPEYMGKAVLSCHSFDSAYLERIRQLVPESLRERFIFSQPGPDRESLIRDGIVVVPSRFESLNLTAYEASVAGAVLLVNGACPAFGEDTPFVDGLNCLKFDGSVEDLAGAMERAIDGVELKPVAWTVTRPFWETPRVKVARTPEPGPQPLVSVCISNRNRGRLLPETLASLAASNHPKLEVVVVDDASTEPHELALLARLEEEAHGGRSPVRLIRNPVHRGEASSRNIGIRAARGKYVLPLDAGDCISPDFLSLAVRALERHPEFLGVVPTLGRFTSQEDRVACRFTAYQVHLGDAPTFSLVHNRIGHATALLRRDILLAHPYDEELERYADWALHLRLVHAGMRFLVTNQVHFFRGLRELPAAESIEPRRHFELMARICERLPSPLPTSLRLSLLLAPMMSGQQALLSMGENEVRFSSEPSAGDRPLRYNVADMLHQAVKQLPLVHPLLKQAVGMARSRISPLRSVLERVVKSST
ncbi:MAG TPA: glycosyltransferase, partial [Archangium sp.]|nr:glycosyltransferase [Archangium sp.]